MSVNEKFARFAATGSTVFVASRHETTAADAVISNSTRPAAVDWILVLGWMGGQ